jgi:hypothetical protein
MNHKQQYVLKNEDHFHQIFYDDEMLVVVEYQNDNEYEFDYVFLHLHMVFDVIMFRVMMNVNEY